MPSQTVLELAIVLSVQFHNTLQNLQIKMSFPLTKSHTRLLYVEDLVSFQKICCYNKYSSTTIVKLKI
jgi:hypothetical protein